MVKHKYSIISTLILSLTSIYGMDGINKVRDICKWKLVSLKCSCNLADCYNSIQGSTFPLHQARPSLPHLQTTELLPISFLILQYKQFLMILSKAKVCFKGKLIQHGLEALALCALHFWINFHLKVNIPGHSTFHII